MVLNQPPEKKGKPVGKGGGTEGKAGKPGKWKVFAPAKDAEWKFSGRPLSETIPQHHMMPPLSSLRSTGASSSNQAPAEARVRSPVTDMSLKHPNEAFEHSRVHLHLRTYGRYRFVFTATTTESLIKSILDELALPFEEESHKDDGRSEFVILNSKIRIYLSYGDILVSPMTGWPRRLSAPDCVSVTRLVKKIVERGGKESRGEVISQQ